MGFLLDTDICSFHLKGMSQVFSRVMQHAGQLHVSALTVGELYVWALRTRSTPRHREELERFLGDMQIQPVDQRVAICFGELQAALRDRGRPAPAIDLFIAATAISHGLTLVTHNVADYAEVPGLSVVDWSTTG